MSQDPIVCNPELYKVVFENDRVRVLEYRDQPGERTTPHRHPDSVMVTLSAFQRRLMVGSDAASAEHLTGGNVTGGSVTGGSFNGENLAGVNVIHVDKSAHEVSWLPAQTHVGENVGATPTHVIFVELK